MHHAKPKIPLNVMEKRIPQNPKYKNLQSKIDTGATINKVRLISTKEFLKRRDEIFRRITCACLAKLFGEYEDGGDSNSGQPEMVARMVKKGGGKFVMERVPAEDNQSSTSGGPRIVSYDAEEQEEYDPPYLILDTRSEEEFAVNRIHRAKSFPASYLCRDMLLPEMHRYKNHESKLIILYDLDEKAIAQTAHTLVQRGFDNIYVLTGGLVEYAYMNPDHIEGVPLPKRPVDSSKRPTRDVYKGSSGMSTTGPKSVKSVSTRRKDSASEVSSVSISLSVAETVISKAVARKARVQGVTNYR